MSSWFGLVLAALTVGNVVMIFVAHKRGKYSRSQAVGLSLISAIIGGWVIYDWWK